MKKSWFLIMAIASHIVCRFRLRKPEQRQRLQAAARKIKRQRKIQKIQPIQKKRASRYLLKNRLTKICLQTEIMKKTTRRKTVWPLP